MPDSKQLAVPALVRDLFDPRDGLPEDIDQRLFGQAFDTIGLHPEDLIIDEVQYEMVIQVFDVLKNYVETGRWRKVAPTIQYFLDVVGGKLTVVLARAKQYHEERARQLEKERPFYKPWPSKQEKDHTADAEHLTTIIERINQSRDALQDAIKVSFMIQCRGDEVLGKELSAKATLDRALGAFGSLIALINQQPGTIYIVKERCSIPIGAVESLAVSVSGLEPALGDRITREIIEPLVGYSLDGKGPLQAVREMHHQLVALENATDDHWAREYERRFNAAYMGMERLRNDLAAKFDVHAQKALRLITGSDEEI